MKRMQNGYIIYRGPSALDGRPIVAVATGFKVKSRNPKTGDMVATYILRDDLPPLQALKLGEDASVCGDCKHRNGSCYVQVGQAVTNVWLAAQAGTYGTAVPLARLRLLGWGQAIRLGSYGDPAAVPIAVWCRLTAQCRAWTGYTHQWRTCDQGLRELCMASVDTPLERELASTMGWRTFRVRRADEPVGRAEVACPASEEMGHKTTCEACRACGGTGSRARADITIQVHGVPRVIAAFAHRQKLSPETV